MRTGFQQQNQNGLLNVQAIFRLIEYNGTRRVDDRRRNFVSAMRRQAVHEHGMLGGMRKQLAIHLEGREDLLPLSGLALLPHAGPDIGVDGVGAGYGLDRIIGDAYLRPGQLRQALRVDSTIGAFGS